jgi:ATP-binding cassette subfamily C protein
MRDRHGIAALYRGLSYWRALRQSAGNRRLFLIVLLVVAGGLMEGVGLLMLVPLLGMIAGTPPDYIRWIVPAGFHPDLTQLLVFFVALVGTRAVLIRERDVALFRLRMMFVDGLRNEIQGALAAANWRFLGRLDHAGLLSTMQADIAAVNNGTYILAQTVSGLAMGIAGFAVAVSILPGLSLAILALALLIGFTLRRQLNRVAVLGAQSSAAQRLLTGVFTDFLGGMKQIKAGAIEREHVRLFAERNGSLSGKQAAFFSSQANSRALFEFGAAAFLALFLYLVHTFGRLPVAELLLIVLIFARLFPLLKTMHGHARLLWYMLPAFASVQRLLRRARLAAEIPAASVAGKLVLAQGIEFLNVTFRYESGVAALEGIDLLLPARRTVALVGASGAGKTTAADLALGLLVPAEGAILVDGLPLVGERAGRWRRSVGYVPQDPFLFPDSIRANLRRFHPSASEEQMWEALRCVAGDQFVRELPQGLDTLVGERGNRLSGGERQRIALARAMLGDPEFLVLDEATSQLDAESEALIHCVLAGLRGRVTVLVIAHRLSTLRVADQVIVLDGGKVKQRGDWDLLAGTPGTFQNLLRAIHP